MNQTLTIGVGALLAGGAVGFILGNAGSGDAEEQALAREVGQAKIQRLGASGGGEADARSSRSKPRDLDEAMSEPGQVARVQALIDLYSDMDPTQLEAEAGKLERLPFGERILAANLLFSRWGEVDPLGALEFTKTMGFGGNFARPTVLRSWASMDPVNAAQYYVENQDEFGGPGRGGPGGQGSEVVAAEWAKLDPNAALEWAKTLEGGERNEALESVVGEMARKDPAGAAALAATLDPESRADAFAEVAEQWAATDFEAAEAWIRSLPSDEQGQAMATALETLASSDPSAAADKALAMGSGEHRDEAVREVAEAWSRQDPATAADWLVSQNPENAGGSMREVMVNWSNQDSAGALSFINEQPLGEMRDSATQAYLWSNRDTAPQDAVTLAEAITDDRDRNRTIMMTAGRWMQEDASAARTYIEQSSALSDRAKDRLLNGGGDGGPGGGQGGWRGRGR